MATLHLEIVTPTTTAYAGEAAEVVLPGALGEMGILPSHLPLVTTLAAGQVVAKGAGDTRYFAVGSGFAQVHADRVRVLVDSCDGASDIDVAHAKAELADLEKRLGAAEFKTQAELDEATEEAARARARIAIVERATKG